MSTTAKSPTAKTYFWIFGWLMVLTVLEIIIAGFTMPRTMLAIFMVGTAIAKSLLIVLYFMHMKFEHLAMWLLPIIPLLLAVFFVVMLFPDIVYQATLDVFYYE